MLLSTSYLHNKNVTAAACEVLNNVSYLFMGGYFEEGLEIVNHLAMIGDEWEVWLFDVGEHAMSRYDAFSAFMEETLTQWE